MKAQLTIMILIVIFVVFVVGLFLFLIGSNYESDGSAGVDGYEVGAFKRNAHDCFRGVYRDSLNVVGFRGGYYTFPDADFVVSEYGFVPYYYHLGNVSLMSEEILESEISDYVLNNIDECTNDSYYRMNVSFGEYTPYVDVEEDKVLFSGEVFANIGDVDGSKRIDLAEKEFYIDSDILEMSKIANFVASYALENDENLCVSCVISRAKENDLAFHAVDLLTENNEFLYFVYTDNVNRYPKVYQFMSRYKYEGMDDVSAVPGGGI